MRFLLLTEAPGVETDFGTHAVVDITPELAQVIATRRQLFLQVQQQPQGKQLSEMHFEDSSATFYDGVPPELKLSKAQKAKLISNRLIQLTDNTPDLGEEVADTPTDFDWMIINEHGVSWQGALKHICFACFTETVPYNMFLPETA